MGGQRLLGLVLGITALGLVVLFVYGLRPPVAWSILVFLVCFGAVAVFLRSDGIPILSLYVLGLYSLPFINLVDHAIHSPDYFRNQDFIWGISANEYQRDPSIISALGLVGAIGILGLAAGMLLAGSYRDRRRDAIVVRTPLAWPSFSLLL